MRICQMTIGKICSALGGFMQQKLKICLFPFLFCSCLTFALESFSTGYELFSTNRPEEAIPFFEKALTEANVSPSVYIYLGIAYYQTGRYIESIDLARKALVVSGTNKRIIAFNAGNSAYALRDFATAEEMYSLSCAADPSFANPVLNRANARLSQQKYSDALVDYQQYLLLDPNTEQRAEVEAIIRALMGEIEFQAQETQRLALEAERLKAEEERMKAEMERLAAEKAEAERIEQERLAAERAAEEARLAAEREAEAERRRKLLEEVAASLQETETTSMNAGSEGVIEYEFEAELD